MFRHILSGEYPGGRNVLGNCPGEMSGVELSTGMFAKEEIVHGWNVQVKCLDKDFFGGRGENCPEECTGENVQGNVQGKRMSGVEFHRNVRWDRDCPWMKCTGKMSRWRIFFGGRGQELSKGMYRGECSGECPGQENVWIPVLD